MCGAACHKSSSSPTTPTPTPSTGPPLLSVSNANITFGLQAVGAVSGSQVVTLTNTGGGSIALGGFQITPEFAETHTCGSALASAASCTVTLTFTPSAVGTRTGTLTIKDDLAVGGHVLPLSGTGNYAQLVGIVPASVAFPATPVATSASQSVVLTNTGFGGVTVLGATATGDFSQSGCVGQTIPAGASCSITVSFVPSVPGNRTGILTVHTDSPGTPFQIAVTGSGYNTAPLVSLVQSSLGFPSTAVGSTSAAQTAQFQNIGPVMLSISSIVVTGDFSQTNSCGASLAPNAICTLNVTFKPGATGMRTGAITISDNTAAGKETIALSGTGAGGTAGPQVSLSPASVSFGAQAVGTTGAGKSVTLTNTGGAALTLSSITASPDFTVTSGCDTQTIPAGASCTISVAFKPIAAGGRSGTLAINDNSPGSPHEVVLTGTGTGASGPAVLFSPAVLSFLAQAPGTTSDPLSVMMTNFGGSTLAISSVATEGEFAQTNNCGGGIAAGASCTINVTFKPSVLGTRTGRVVITDNAGDSPHVIGVNGLASVAFINLTPSLTFVNQAVGSTSAAQPVTVSNAGGTIVFVSSITASGDFSQTNDCGTSIGPGATCTVTVNFTPTTTGTRAGTITIVDDATGSPRTVVLTGTGS